MWLIIHLPIQKDLFTIYKETPNYFDLIPITWSDIQVRDGQQPNQPQLDYVAGIYAPTIGMKDIRKICAKLGVTCERKDLRYKCMNRIATLKRNMEPEDQEKKKYLEKIMSVTWPDVVVQNDRNNNPKVRTILGMDVFEISTHMIRVICKQLGLSCSPTDDKVSCLQQMACKKRCLEGYDADPMPPKPEDPEKKMYMEKIKSVTWSDVVVRNDRNNNPKVRAILDWDVFRISAHMVRMVCRQLGLGCYPDDKLSCLHQMALKKRLLEDYEAKQKPPISEILVWNKNRLNETNQPSCGEDSTHALSSDPDLCSDTVDSCIVDKNFPCVLWSDNVSILGFLLSL